MMMSSCTRNILQCREHVRFFSHTRFPAFLVRYQTNDTRLLSFYCIPLHQLSLV